MTCSMKTKELEKLYLEYGDDFKFVIEKLDDFCDHSEKGIRKTIKKFDAVFDYDDLDELDPEDYGSEEYEYEKKKEAKEACEEQIRIALDEITGGIEDILNEMFEFYDDAFEEGLEIIDDYKEEFFWNYDEFEDIFKECIHDKSFFEQEKEFRKEFEKYRNTFTQVECKEKAFKDLEKLKKSWKKYFNECSYDYEEDDDDKYYCYILDTALDMMYEDAEEIISEASSHYDGVDYEMLVEDALYEMSELISQKIEEIKEMTGYDEISFSRNSSVETIEIFSFLSDSLINEINMEMEEASDGFKKTVNDNHDLKENIYKNHILEFKKDFSKISNISVRKPKLEGKFKEICSEEIDDFEFITCDRGLGTLLKETVVTGLVVALFGPIGAATYEIIKREKLHSKAIIAETEYEKLKLDVLEVKKEIAKVTEVSKNVEEVSNLLVAFMPIMTMADNKVKDLISEYGCDALKYTDEQFEELMVCVNIFKAVNELVVQPIILKNGELNKKLVDHSSVEIKKYIESGEGLLNGSVE